MVVVSLLFGGRCHRKVRAASRFDVGSHQYQLPLLADERRYLPAPGWSLGRYETSAQETSLSINPYGGSSARPL